MDRKYLIEAFEKMCQHNMTVHVKDGGVTDVSQLDVMGDVREYHSLWPSVEEATARAIFRMEKNIRKGK